MSRLVVVLSLFVAACGASEPEAEATWETHSTAPDETSGAEAGDGAGDGAGDEAAR